MSTVTVSEKGQMVIPADLRRRLGIGPGTRLAITAEGGGFRVAVEAQTKWRTAAEIAGIAGYEGRRVPVGKMTGLAAARILARRGKL